MTYSARVIIAIPEGCLFHWRICSNGHLETVEMENWNWKLKRKTEMVKMKIVYFPMHTALKRPPANKTTRITIYSAC